MNICFCTWRGDIILIMNYLNYNSDKCGLLTVKRETLKSHMEEKRIFQPSGMGSSIQESASVNLSLCMK